jgi:hypothetical protein
MVENVAYVRSLNQCCGTRAHPLSVTSPEENAFVLGLLASFRQPGPAQYAYIGLVVIGLNNNAEPSQYLWQDTMESVTNSGGYQNWCTGCAPVKGRQFCTAMSIDDGT